MPVPQSRLSPLDIGSLIEETIALYRDNWKVFLTICTIVLVPTGVLQLGLTLMLDRSVEAEDVGQLFAAALGALLLAFVTGIGLLILTAAMIHATSAAWHSDSIGVNEAFDRGFSRLGWLFLITALGAIALGAIAITIVGLPVALYLGVSWTFAAPALLLESAGVAQALGRSRELVKGRWWRVFGILVLIAIVQSMISAIFTFPGTILGAGTIMTGGSADAIPADARVVSQIGSTIGQMFSYPIAACAYILLYYDLRIRHDGSDRRHMEETSAQPIVRVDRSF